MSQKASDYRTLPVCARHHRQSIFSIHQYGREFWNLWKLDPDVLIEVYQNLYKEQGGKINGQ
jgi:hypothetical protein